MTSMSHFSAVTDPKLFRCSCNRPACDAPPPSELLLSTLEVVRFYLHEPMVVTSGPRCAEWNEHEHGEVDSDHLSGQGADIVVVDSGARYRLLAACFQAGVTRLGVGRNFLHIGVPRNKPQDVVWTYYTMTAVVIAAPGIEPGSGGL